jgi:phosphoribosylamine--glycine ligase
MTSNDKKREIEIMNNVFHKLRGKTNNPGLRGMPFYDAFIHTSEGPKILENNSRPGDPEIQNILPILKDDFVDLCFRMIDGSLTRIETQEKATVVTYKVPPTYGGFDNVFPQRVDSSDIDRPIDLIAAHKLREKWGDKIRIYPASMELRNGKTYALKSRTICVVGVGDDIENARQISLDGIRTIKGGSLWHRTDIASKEHVAKSVSHMKTLRALE